MLWLSLDVTVLQQITVRKAFLIHMKSLFGPVGGLRGSWALTAPLHD